MWSLEPGVIAGLILSAFLYYRGMFRMRRQSLAGRGIRGREAACFASGWLAVFIALVSPLDALGEALFSARIAQRVLLALVAAPMLALGRPLTAFPWALPAEWRRLGRPGAGARARVLWRAFVGPFAAWLIYAAMLWLWHVPTLFQAALESDLASAAQHLSLLVSAFIFCDVLMIYGRDRQMGYGAAMIYVFTACAHTMLLGALLADASTVWYPAYEAAHGAAVTTWGLTSLEDQRLGGLLLWFPVVAINTTVGLILFFSWLRESERKAPAEEKALLLDTDLWNSKEWLRTHRDRV